jgi:hypothetical protein
MRSSSRETEEIKNIVIMILPVKTPFRPRNKDYPRDMKLSIHNWILFTPVNSLPMLARPSVGRYTCVNRRSSSTLLLTRKSLANAVGLGAIVNERFLEPGVLQRRLCGDPIFGIINEDLLQQVEE